MSDFHSKLAARAADCFMASALCAIAALWPQDELAQERRATAQAAWQGFPALVWRQGRGAAPLSAPFSKAFGGTVLERDERAAWLDGTPLAFYVEHAPGRDELHLDRNTPAYQKRWRAWYDTRDDRLLVREPCLSDPATRSTLFAQLASTIATREGRVGLGVSLGDEISQTPAAGPEDICLCAHCRTRWRAFLERERASGATELAADFDPALASTDATRLALTEGRTEALHAWLLRRRFQQEVLLELVHSLADEAHRLAPGAGVGLLGITGQSAFGGVAVERLLPQLDFAECYRTNCARELLFTLRTEQQHVLQTIFPERNLPDGAAWQTFEAWAHGADGCVIWSDRELEQRPPYSTRMARAVADLRRIKSALPGFTPWPHGVAILHSPDSVAYAWLRDALLDGATWPKRFQGYQESHGTLETSLRAWLRVLEDCGAEPGAWPIDALGADTVRRFPLLVANQLAILDEADVARLSAFLGAGGYLAVSGPLGEFDSRGRRPPESVFETLRKLAPERVRTLATFSAGYLDVRTIRGQALRVDVRSLLTEVGVALAPWRIHCDDAAMPWLCTWSVDSDGVWSCAALPNLQEPSERAAPRAPADEKQTRRLSELVVSIDPPNGAQLEWIHPSEPDPSLPSRARRLPAGDAAVFRLVPIEVERR